MFLAILPFYIEKLAYGVMYIHLVVLNYVKLGCMEIKVNFQ